VKIRSVHFTQSC